MYIELRAMNATILVVMNDCIMDSEYIVIIFIIHIIVINTCILKFTLGRVCENPSWIVTSRVHKKTIAVLVGFCQFLCKLITNLHQNIKL